MLPADIRVGHVLRYSYLWHWQYLEGRDDGDKDRPVLVLAIVSMLEDGSPVVRVLPITHVPPKDLTQAVELPVLVKRRLGMDEERSWIILSESNRFASPGPDLRPAATDSGYLGPLPPALFQTVKRRFVELARRGSHKVAARSE